MLTRDKDNWVPTWSPDGSEIAFRRRRGRYSQICVINADGSGQRRLTRDKDNYAPAWSPDGSRIAFVRELVDDVGADSPGRTKEEIWVMNADGSGQTSLTGK